MPYVIVLGEHVLPYVSFNLWVVFLSVACKPCFACLRWSELVLFKLICSHMKGACVTERVNSLWCTNSVCFHQGIVCSELLWQNLIPTSPLVCSPMQIHLCHRCAKWSRKPSTAPTRALHAEVASAVFPVEATLLSWMTNTSALEVERCCWGGGMCFPTFQLLVSFPEYFIILPCHFEHHSTLDAVKLFHVCPRA